MTEEEKNILYKATIENLGKDEIIDIATCRMAELIKLINEHKRKLAHLPDVRRCISEVQVIAEILGVMYCKNAVEKEKRCEIARLRMRIFGCTEENSTI